MIIEKLRRRSISASASFSIPTSGCQLYRFSSARIRLVELTKLAANSSFFGDNFGTGDVRNSINRSLLNTRKTSEVKSVDFAPVSIAEMMLPRVRLPSNKQRSSKAISKFNSIPRLLNPI